MADGKQIDLVMRDMLFLTWAIEPDRARTLVPRQLELDIDTDSAGRARAFISAVCFRVAEVRSSLLPLPNLSFEQVNYRAYVKAGSVPAVCFLDLKVNSRMVTSLTGFLGVPIHYEDIDIAMASTGSRDSGSAGSYAVKSAGLRAEVTIGAAAANPAENGHIAPEFITDRLVGYAAAGGGVYEIRVEQPGLNSVSARVASVHSLGLEQLGLLTVGSVTLPDSALYVREALFGADMPTRVW